LCGVVWLAAWSFNESRFLYKTAQPYPGGRHGHDRLDKPLIGWLRQKYLFPVDAGYNMVTAIPVLVDRVRILLIDMMRRSCGFLIQRKLEFDHERHG